MRKMVTPGTNGGKIALTIHSGMKEMSTTSHVHTSNVPMNLRLPLTVGRCRMDYDAWRHTDLQM